MKKRKTHETTERTEEYSVFSKRIFFKTWMSFKIVRLMAGIRQLIMQEDTEGGKRNGYLNC